MTDREATTDSRRRLRRWLVSGGVAAVAIAAIAILTPGSPLGLPGTPASSPGASTVDPTGPVEGSATPSDGATPTTPVLPEQSPATSGTTSPATPRPQPTENDDSPPRETKEPVDIADEATPAAGIEARLVLIESVEGEVVIPGEVGGPALRVTLEVTNNTAEDLATPAVVVNLYKGEALSPAGPLLKPGGVEFPAEISSGQSVKGVYLFTVGPDERDLITVEVDLAVGTPILLFQGSVE